jgi:hypothetical protein
MRDKKDNATLDLPGFGSAAAPAPDIKRTVARRIKKMGLKQEQLELLAPTDNSGLPPWSRDHNTVLTGLPVWSAA